MRIVLLLTLISTCSLLAMAGPMAGPMPEPKAGPFFWPFGNQNNQIRRFVI